MPWWPFSSFCTVNTKRDKRRKKAKSARRPGERPSYDVYEKRALNIAKELHPDWGGMNTDIKQEALNAYGAILRDGQGQAAETVAAALMQAHLDVVTEVIERQEIADELAEMARIADEVEAILLAPIDYDAMSSELQMEARTCVFQRIGATCDDGWADVPESEKMWFVYLYRGCLLKNKSNGSRAVADAIVEMHMRVRYRDTATVDQEALDLVELGQDS